MARIVHFDISANDPNRFMKFYEKVFAWKFEKWDGPMDYWMITTGPDNKPGINGGLLKRMKDNSVQNTIEVESIDQTIKQIREYGGKITQEKDAIPGVGYFAEFIDPDDNVLGIMENDPNAK